jgi:tetratricopeptide (TPR) repeat protein
MKPLIWFCMLGAAILHAAEQPLADVYREAKAALEAGDAARCAELLEPALKDVVQGEAAPAQLALGIAWLRLGKGEEAVAMLTKAAAHFSGTPQAPDAWAPLGDALRAAGKPGDAGQAYARAAGAEGKSANITYAKARVNELEGERLEGMSNFAAAADAYLNAAELLLALGQNDSAYLADARAIFEKVARGSGKPGKDWRGEATARAVYGLGEVERVGGKLTEAIAYYQRTFVSWVRYPVWAARAYLRAAECMDKLGKRPFAIRHLRELVRKVDKYGNLPEYAQAKAQLRAWGEDVR